MYCTFVYEHKTTSSFGMLHSAFLFQISLCLSLSLSIIIRFFSAATQKTLHYTSPRSPFPSRISYTFGPGCNFLTPTQKIHNSRLLSHHVLKRKESILRLFSNCAKPKKKTSLIIFHNSILWSLIKTWRYFTERVSTARREKAIYFGKSIDVRWLIQT